MTDRITPIYQGRIITLNLEHVTFPDGHSFDLEIVHHPGGAAVVALDKREYVCLLRQYRHAAGGWLWELPAGKLDPGEAPQLTAQRELQEEAGIAATHWQGLGSMISSPGIFTEVVHLFLARRLAKVHSQTEDEEYIEVHWLPFSKAVTWASEEKIVDAKTVIGLLRAQALLQNR